MSRSLLPGTEFDRPRRPRPAIRSAGGARRRLRPTPGSPRLGIAVGSAAKTAAIHSIDCRCQTRVAVAARKLGLIQADHAVTLSLSMTHKAVGFDRPMPEADFDHLDLRPTGTRPVGVPRAARHSGARNRQAPRQPIRRTPP